MTERRQVRPTSAKATVKAALCWHLTLATNSTCIIAVVSVFLSRMRERREGKERSLGADVFKLLFVCVRRKKRTWARPQCQIQVFQVQLRGSESMVMGRGRAAEGPPHWFGLQRLGGEGDSNLASSSWLERVSKTWIVDAFLSNTPSISF